MSMNFGSKDGILIRTMTVEDYKQIDESVYSGEPLISCFEKEIKEIYEARRSKFDDYHISLIEKGDCLVAINENDNGRIVGLVLAFGKVPSDLVEEHKWITQMPASPLKRIMMFNYEGRAKANLFERYGVSKLIYSHITNVNASMRGRGIGTRLAAALMELGRARGFPLMTAACSSFYSARQKEALGMECVYSQAYADYKDDDGQVVFNPPAPHTQLRILAIKL
ncbi:dopamine N-acetyltransferase-like [Drosophila innubila]|uniref:dopamine N-acetyltransferase-like n=1 Tax=Drosophila innubila TaxID=198719 RepID=UPI00148DFC77|nr:dopamine N-acetyltransferase-like [Drosophila innubila]